jgi:hypothetical protein
MAQCASLIAPYGLEASFQAALAGPDRRWNGSGTLRTSQKQLLRVSSSSFLEEAHSMSIRGPAIALTGLLILTGCGKAAGSCARAAMEHPPDSRSVREFTERALESSPRPTNESHHDGFGHKLGESFREGAKEGVREGVREGIKQRNTDDQRRDERRQKNN